MFIDMPEANDPTFDAHYIGNGIYTRNGAYLVLAIPLGESRADEYYGFLFDATLHCTPESDNPRDQDWIGVVYIASVDVTVCGNYGAQNHALLLPPQFARCGVRLPRNIIDAYYSDDHETILAWATDRRTQIALYTPNYTPEARDYALHLWEMSEHMHAHGHISIHTIGDPIDKFTCASCKRTYYYRSDIDYCISVIADVFIE